MFFLYFFNINCIILIQFETIIFAVTKLYTYFLFRICSSTIKHILSATKTNRNLFLYYPCPPECPAGQQSCVSPFTQHLTRRFDNPSLHSRQHADRHETSQLDRKPRRIGAHFAQPATQSAHISVADIHRLQPVHGPLPRRSAIAEAA